MRQVSLQSVMIITKRDRKRGLRKRHLKKVNSHCLYRTFSISFNLSNVGNFFSSLIITESMKVQDKKNKSFCLVFTSSRKREIRHNHLVVMQRRQRNVQKKCNARASRFSSCCFANLNLLLFALLVAVVVV